jgi:hypothetical protein
MFASLIKTVVNFCFTRIPADAPPVRGGAGFNAHFGQPVIK